MPFGTNLAHVENYLFAREGRNSQGFIGRAALFEHKDAAVESAKRRAHNLSLRWSIRSASQPNGLPWSDLLNCLSQRCVGLLLGTLGLVVALGGYVDVSSCVGADGQ